MGKFHIYMQILQGNALFSGKIYTVGNIFTRPPVVTVATNFKSGEGKGGGSFIINIYGSLSPGRGKWSKCGILLIFFGALL